MDVAAGVIIEMPPAPAAGSIEIDEVAVVLVLVFVLVLVLFPVLVPVAVWPVPVIVASVFVPVEEVSEEAVVSAVAALVVLEPVGEASAVVESDP